MDIQGDLRWIQQELQNVEDPDIIAMIKNILAYRKKIIQEQRISIEQYNTELDQADVRIESGAFHTQEEIEKIAGQWFSVT